MQKANAQKWAEKENMSTLSLFKKYRSEMNEKKLADINADYKARQEQYRGATHGTSTTPAIPTISPAVESKPLVRPGK